MSRSGRGWFSAARTVAAAVLIVLVTGAARAAETPNSLAVDACADAARASEEMEAAFRKVLELKKEHPEFIGAFHDAQRQWTVFRDAHLEALHPAKDAGTAVTMCRCLELADLTQQRIEMLRRWLDVPVGGDVCAGTTLP